jgi:predicted nucleic acid-binding protein
MIDVVIDASVVLRWAFEDEADRTGALRIEAALRDGRVHAVEPPLFLFEVASTLERGIRERRIDHARAEQVLHALESVSLDEVDPHDLAGSAFRLALHTGIRVPDAAYIEVARIRGAILITTDRRQITAAESLGIPVATLAHLPPL